jgi:GAF domain-containing protein
MTYEPLFTELEALVAGETDWIANCANAASLIYHGLPELNWAGFYYLKGNEMVLGPFQGRPACVRIELGRGVCGSAAQQGQTIVVPDVHAFPGHIACDPVSRSEIVIPIFRAGKLIGVLDLDSPKAGRFSSEDARGLERLMKILVSNSGEKAGEVEESR